MRCLGPALPSQNMYPNTHPHARTHTHTSRGCRKRRHRLLTAAAANFDRPLSSPRPLPQLCLCLHLLSAALAPVPPQSAQPRRGCSRLNCWQPLSIHVEPPAYARGECSRTTMLASAIASPPSGLQPPGKSWSIAFRLSWFPGRRNVRASSASPPTHSRR